MRRSGQTRAIVEKLFAEQNGACKYCGRPTFLGTPDQRHGRPSELIPPTATLDHKQPKQMGGGNGKNLVMACEPCNNLKGSRTWKQWCDFMSSHPEWWMIYARRRAERIARRQRSFIHGFDHSPKDGDPSSVLHSTGNSV